MTPFEIYAAFAVFSIVAAWSATCVVFPISEVAENLAGNVTVLLGGVLVLWLLAKVAREFWSIVTRY